MNGEAKARVALQDISLYALALAQDPDVSKDQLVSAVCAISNAGLAALDAIRDPAHEPSADLALKSLREIHGLGPDQGPGR